MQIAGAKLGNLCYTNLRTKKWSLLSPEPFACCMSKSDRNAKAVLDVAIVRFEGETDWEKRLAPIKRVNGERSTNKANDIISSTTYSTLPCSFVRPTPRCSHPPTALFRPLSLLLGFPLASQPQ